MKIKNIMFSGFAAALFAGVCGAANAAAVELVSKPYADTNLQAKLTAGNNIAIDQDTNTISATGLVTTTALETVQNSINEAIEAGDKESADALAELEVIVEGLQGSVATNETMTALSNRVKAIEDAPYATESYVTNAVDAVEALFADYYNKTDVDNLLNAKATTADLNALGTRVGTAEGKITAAEGKITAAEGKITTLEGAVATKAEADSVYSKTDADAKFATQEFVGELPEGTTAGNIVSFVEEKTANIVDNTEFEALDTRVETAEGKITAAEGEIDALQEATANLSDFVGDSNCIMYMKKEETDSLFAPLWNFLIESKSDTFLISYIKDIYFDDKPHYIIEQNKQYDINDYEKVYFRQNGGIDNLGSREKNVAYPNPTSEIVRIDLDNCSACLCTMDGCELKCVDSNQLLISEFPSGLYLLKVMRNDLIYYEKLIVRK